MNRRQKILATICSTAFLTTAAMAHTITNDPKVVYGNDDRIAPVNLTNPVLKTISNSTAAMIGWDKMKITGDVVDLSDNMTLTEDGYFNICPTERFANEINPANCSGFLIADDILVTAGHCIRSQGDCENNAWVFDFTDSDKKLSKSKSVYKCKKILASILDYTQNDFAVIQLARSTGRDFLPMRTEGQAPTDKEMTVVGHPSGLPQKIAGGAYVRDNSNTNYFIANLDTFGGNSGSPVINVADGVIEGILVRGEKDYRYDANQGCNVVNECSNSGCRGEDVTRITNVSQNMDDILSGNFKSNLDEEKSDDLDFINNYFFRTSPYNIGAPSLLPISLPMIQQ